MNSRRRRNKAQWPSALLLPLLAVVSASCRSTFAFSLTTPELSHRICYASSLHRVTDLNHPSFGPLGRSIVRRPATFRGSAQARRPSKPDPTSLEEHPITHLPYDYKHPDHVTLADVVIMSATTLSAVLSMYMLLHISGKGAWRYYLAGGICAATSHAITTPIDVVKTRMQVDSRLAHLKTPDAAIKIIREEGATTLLAGLGPTAFGYLFEGAVKFGIYEVLKPVVRRFLTQTASSTGIAALKSLTFPMCATASGVAASLMLCPMEALRIRLVAEPDFAPAGWIQGGYKMLRIEGVNGLWKGLTPMLFKQVPYTITKNVSFDVFTRLFYACLRNAEVTIGATIKFAVPLVSAMLASLLSAISSQPGDVLLSLVNAHEGNKRTNNFLKEIWMSEDGLKGLFVGMKARFLHVGVIVTTQLLIYDVVKRLCGNSGYRNCVIVFILE
jgi:solute carrier family 25 phosphate transporter 3